MLRMLPYLANSDGEFAIAARLWDADLLFISGTDAVRVEVRAGRLAEVSAASHDLPGAIRISGPPAGWEKMLQPSPPPFYQDLFGATVHHGFKIEGELLDVYPYYAALRRLIELLRAESTL
jgi:hypothetical protein